MRYISHIPAEPDALPFPRSIALMGCTGSIGCSTLRVLEAWKDSGRFRVEVLAAGRNIQRLAEQAAQWRPPFLAVQEADGPSGIEALRALLRQAVPGYEPEILAGQQGYAALASLDSVDMVLSAQVGAAGLRATCAAAAAGKTICLANKESLVLAGSLIRALCARTGAVVLPVDSEHFALFQGMVGRRESEIARLILTASGGPFRTKDAAFLQKAKPEDALRHPNWSMGAKITIDSATLMNKGLEVIEACHLYQMSVDDVDVLVHPQSIVHSLVELADGAQMGHFAVPDMRIPIAGCLSWPYLLDNRVTGVSFLELAKVGTLTFEEPRRELFPCLDLARRAFAEGRTVELNAANEVAVARFLSGGIGFTHIPALVASVADAASPLPAFELGDDLAASVQAALAEIEKRDAAARAQAEVWQA
ncbi:1-deoxy-D-xylulose-5-phosphate reductoisomerase [Mailhella sp.]|uniref:1-deoxy-D-xylulose-5-phosphate reductoisomerase n=1 Tax=Mailhella sp. TaxID=1981029 RepID=UPI0040635CE3